MEIIARFAPPGENDTAAYVHAVSRSLGISAGAPIDLENPRTLAALCKAIAVHECGGWFFSASDLTDGVALARAA